MKNILLCWTVCLCAASCGGTNQKVVRSEPVQAGRVEANSNTKKTSYIWLWAKLSDGSGLQEEDQVVIAGLPVGYLEKMTVDGEDARVRLRIREDIEIWQNAVLHKKSTALLGSFYLELEAGTPSKVLVEGGRIEYQRLIAGDEITSVTEQTSAEMLLQRLDR